MKDYYLIKRVDQGGGYLSEYGSEKSYTKSLILARKFDSREAAKAQCCENERAVSLAGELGVEE